MTRDDDDFTGRLEGYLDEYLGSTPLPDEARDVIRAQLPSISGTPVLTVSMRFLEMTMHIPPARHGLVAAIASVAAVLGASYVEPWHRWTARLDSSPLPLATPGALPTAASLEPGTYVVANPHRGDDSDPILGCPSSCSDYQVDYVHAAGWLGDSGRARLQAPGST